MSKQSQTQNIKPKNRLQHLLAKIAGNDTAKAVKPKMKNEFYLNDISENSSGGGGGGSEPFVVTFDSENGSAECDKTFAQIKEAYEAGKQINVMFRFVPINGINGAFRLFRMNAVFYNNDFGFTQLRALGTIDATDTTLVIADCYIAPGLAVGHPDGVTIKYYNYEHNSGPVTEE